MINWILYAVLIAMVARGLMGRESWTVLAAAFFIPLTQVLPSPVGIISASANLIVLGLLLAWLRVAPDRPAQPPTTLRGPVILMAAFILVGAAHRYHLEVNEGQVYLNSMTLVFSETKEWLMAYVTYFLVFRLAEGRALLSLAWRAGLLCAGGEVTLAVYERLQGIGRATAHLDEPNRAGAYFAAAVPLFLACALLQRGHLRTAGAAGATMAVAAVFATLSRGGILAAVSGALVVLAVFYVFVKGGNSKLGVAAIVVVVLINGSLLVPQRVVDRLVFTFTGSSGSFAEPGKDGLDQSSEERLALWRVCLDLMGDRPLGIGFYTFATEAGRHLDMHKVAHNIYLQVGTELGVAALATLLLLVFLVGWRCWRAFRLARGPDEAALALGLLGGWVSMCVAVIFINPFFAYNFSGQIWVLMAVAFKITARQEELESSGDAAA